MLGPPINLPKWLQENSHLLQPPVNNHCVYNEGFVIMIVGGPNARTDYHINPTPEFFYQHRGAMLLRVVDTSASAPATFRDVVIREGDMFLLPANVPHNPVRFADTVGLVVEQARPADALDRLRWYCVRCSSSSSSSTSSSDTGVGQAPVVVHEAAFHATDLGTQVKAAVEDFCADVDKRRCLRCGELADSAPPPGSIQDPNLPE